MELSVWPRHKKTAARLFAAVDTGSPLERPYAIHWRDFGTVRVASLQSALFFRSESKVTKKAFEISNAFYMRRGTVMAGGYPVFTDPADRDLLRDTSLNVTFCPG